MNISIIIPACNEDASIRPLVEQINSALQNGGPVTSYEIIIVDDGSSDGTWKIIQELSADPNFRVKGIRMRRNFGKATALNAGFQECVGDLVFTMDADLQDDPKEIPRFIEKIEEGFDMVSGWKLVRNDPISKTMPSRLFNRVTAFLTGIELHDFNCGFKCYKREVIENMDLYGELHRYIPVLAHDLGFKVGELPVEHHPRTHGVSKYGWERYARGTVDLLTVLATTRWLQKPGHLFGGIGLLVGFIGLCVLGYLFIVWSFGWGTIGGRPLLTFGVLTTLISLQLVSLGVIAEFLIKFSRSRKLSPLISARTQPPNASQEH